MVSTSKSATQVVLVANPRRNAGLGLVSALTFLLYVTRFSGSLHSKPSDRLKRHQGADLANEGVLRTVGRILLPSCNAREAFTATKLSLCLLLRTYGSVWVSRHWGKIVNSIVILDFPRLRQLSFQFAGATVLLSLLNSLLKFYIANLKVQVREKITAWCHRTYMRPSEMIYYKANRLGDSRIENFDHQISSDVERFSHHFSIVVSQSLKPLVDFLVYSVELSRVQGLATPLTLYVWFTISSCISAITLPPYAELAATDQQLEGQFRSRHSQLIARCEQVAFQRGEAPELEALTESFDRLLAHARHSLSLMFNAEVVRQYLNKYSATMLGLFLVARPLRLGLQHGALPYTSEQIAQYFTSTWRNMESMASAITDMFELTDRVGSLSGLASRVGRLMSDLEVRPPVLQQQVEAAKKGPHPPVIKAGSNLKFEHVSVYKPDGTLLVKDLNFSVERGQRILVTGANGCGKSSLFRVLRRLWPHVEGTITMPSDREIHFMPQVHFVPIGSLRNVVIYPQSRREMEKDGRTDKEIMTCLRWAHCSPDVVVDDRAQLEFTDGGVLLRPKLSDVRDWQKELSPGQKQRLAFARLFYHKPRFVVLDECTNGVSPEVEHDLYGRCKKLGLAVFSISHKNELKLFHDYELHYTGDAEGTWAWSECAEQKGKVTRASSIVKLPEKGADGRFESRITYERHVWFVE